MNDEERQNRIAELTLAWFKKGENDLKTADRCLSWGDLPTDIICFHAQQCAEKYLKGFLTFHQIYFPKTHDIKNLVELCTEVESNIGIKLESSYFLSDYAVEARYPGEQMEIEIDEATEAVKTARKVKLVILKNLKGKLQTKIDDFQLKDH